MTLWPGMSLATNRKLVLSYFNGDYTSAFNARRVGNGDRAEHFYPENSSNQRAFV